MIAYSWSTALLVWPLTWWLLASAQGLGVALLGGQWIGLSVPFGAAPWGLVNEPSISFAVSRGALFGYWLAPLLLAATLALIAPPLLPGGGAWFGELVVFHLAFSCAFLGLGWSPPLGLGDGTVAGLERFWEVEPLVTVGLALAVAVIAVQASAVRLVAPLWDAPGGPLRRRRVAAAFAHGAVPAGAWCGAAMAIGWRPPAATVATASVVVVALLGAAWLWVPRHPRLRRRQPVPGRVLATAVVGICLLLVALWFGAPRAGRAQAVLWAAEGTTSNVRSELARVRLRPDHRAQPESSGPRS